VKPMFLPTLEEFGAWYCYTSPNDFMCMGRVLIYVSSDLHIPVMVSVFTGRDINSLEERFSIASGTPPYTPILDAMCRWASDPLV
jgi:hypothetical protein